MEHTKYLANLTAIVQLGIFTVEPTLASIVQLRYQATDLALLSTSVQEAAITSASHTTTTPTDAVAPTGTDTGATKSDGLSNGAKIGIGVGVSVGVLFALAIGVYVWIKRKRQVAAAASQHSVPDGFIIDPPYYTAMASEARQ